MSLLSYESGHVPVGHVELSEDKPPDLTANEERSLSVSSDPHFSHVCVSSLLHFCRKEVTCPHFLHRYSTIGIVPPPRLPAWGIKSPHCRRVHILSPVSSQSRTSGTSPVCKVPLPYAPPCFRILGRHTSLPALLQTGRPCALGPLHQTEDLFRLL